MCLVNTTAKDINLELRPCPCCGSGDVEIITAYSYGSPVYLVACKACPIRTDRSCGKESVVDAWNRRVPDSKANQETEEDQPGWCGHCACQSCYEAQQRNDC
jgi:hypothetical protein